MKWTIPNVLTTLRLLAAPGVPVMFLYFHRPIADWFALTLFVSAAITDYFDGYLARLWKQESKFGTMLDPIADKAMVVIALLILTGYSGMNPWLILSFAILLEVSGTLCLKLSQGMTRPLPVIGVAVFYLGTFFLMSLSLKNLEVGTAYAIWSGVGTALIATIGILCFGESFHWVKVLGLCFIIGGVILLRQTSS